MLISRKPAVYPYCELHILIIDDRKFPPLRAFKPFTEDYSILVDLSLVGNDPVASLPTNVDGMLVWYHGRMSTSTIVSVIQFLNLTSSIQVRRDNQIIDGFEHSDLMSFILKYS